MSLATDLIEQARMLAGLDTTNPKQASLRRAVSAAYYGLFHLLVEEGVKLFVRNHDALAAKVSRTFDHNTMKTVSGHFKDQTKGLPKGISPNTAYQIHADLKTVAEAFIKLQESRHDADYNLDRQFSLSEAQELIRAAETAFASWENVRDTNDARLYLASFLVWSSWKEAPKG